MPTTLPYRILDLTDERGVFCTRLLADLGADVVRVEPPDGGNMRKRPPFFHDEPGLEKSLPFLFYNTNKKSITLNLEHKDGQLLFKELVKRADAVVESFDVGYLGSLGLDYQMLQKVNPKLVMCSISWFGQNGPSSHLKGCDLTIQAASGYANSGEPDGPPMRLGNEQSVYPAGLYGAVGVLAALYGRDVLGKGQRIDISSEEALMTFCLDQGIGVRYSLFSHNLVRMGRTARHAVPNGIFPCKDGWFFFVGTTAAEWDALAKWIYETTGNEEVLNEKYRGSIMARTPHLDIIEAMMVEFGASYSKAELLHEGQKRALRFAPENTVSDVLDDPQLNESGFWVTLNHAVAGNLKYPLQVWSRGDTSVSASPAPTLGEHNGAIYCGELNVPQEHLGIMRSAGII